MDRRTTLLSLPESPRDFGFYIDGQWHAGREMFTRLSPGHGVAVTRMASFSCL